MSYIENPKTKGSGIICAIPQVGQCPVKCDDCFFQSGRSYLEPLEKNLPNLPDVDESNGFIVRMNDGNDSNNQRDVVVKAASEYRDAFYNTSMPLNLADFDRPVVLTVNPGKMTDKAAHLIEISKNLMFVRFRINAWNLELADRVVKHYTNGRVKVPVVMTFMAYYTSQIPKEYADKYSLKKRTLNEYLVILPSEWKKIMDVYADNAYVYSCGKDSSTHSCSRCGNCLREYFNSKVRMSNK
jgi:hypothetical protein